MVSKRVVDVPEIHLVRYELFPAGNAAEHLGAQALALLINVGHILLTAELLAVVVDGALVEISEPFVDKAVQLKSPVVFEGTVRR